MRTQGISGFTPAWASYEIIIAAMVFEVLANYCDGHPEFHALRMPLFITGFVWLAVGVGLSTFTVIVAKTALRGFGLRWGIMIGVWSVCYLALMLHTSVPDAAFHHALHSPTPRHRRSRVGNARPAQEQKEHPMSTHPRNDLNPAFTNPLRFSLMATLAGVEKLPFKDARDYLGTTDSTLSKHASALEEAGFVTIMKGFLGKKPQTTLKLSKQGRTAWAAHLDALRQIAFPQDTES